MSKPKMPTDANDNPIPALGFKDQANQTIPATAASARNTTDFQSSTKVILLTSTVPVFIRFGGSTITATSSDAYLPAGSCYIAINQDAESMVTRIAVIRADTTDGTVYVSEMQ